MKLAIALLALIPLLASGCGEQRATTTTFINAPAAVGLVGLENGGLRYANRATGDIWEADANGKQGTAPIGHVATKTGNDGGGVLSMAVDTTQRTFASWINTDGMLTVGQVAPGVTRMIWTGPAASGSHIGGDLSFTPTGRLLIAVGDLGQPVSPNDSGSFNGKLLTLDPDRNGDQQPNTISAGWHNPSVVLYDQSGTLWVGEVDGTNTSSIDRLSTNGTVASTAKIPNGGVITGFTQYGEKELAACLSGSRKVTRYLINDREAVPGRTVASDCTGDVTQMKSGALAYVNPTEIRATAK